MIANLGMDQDMGLINYELLASKNLSMSNNLITRANEILKELYEDTLKLIEEHRIKLDKLSKSLLEKETLGEEEIDNIIF